MGEYEVWQKGFQSGVRLARATVGFGKGRRRAGQARMPTIPPGAHRETFAEAIRWGEPFLDWGRLRRWFVGDSA